MDSYPNLQAVLNGRVSGQSTEWPLVRAELRDLMNVLERIDRIGNKLVDEALTANASLIDCGSLARQALRKLQP